MFDVWGFGWVWVGLGHGSISSPGNGLGWVGSLIWWVGLGWVDENRPTDNSDLKHCLDVWGRWPASIIRFNQVYFIKKVPRLIPCVLIA